MATIWTPRRIGGAAVLGLAALGWVLVGRGQQPAVPKAKAEAINQDQAKAKYLGARYCAGCHSPPAKFPIDFVLLDEYKTWKEKDKHSKAYDKLTSERSKQIAALMRINDPTREDRCLSCHAVNVPKALREEEAEDQTFKIEDGVTCDACHGPASRWAVPHSLPGWRKKPMEQKVALGMTDVRNPVFRATLCYSCHIGNGKDKIVTHDMYAAGHPPLPSIEVASFSAAMPRHWRYQYQKTDKGVRKLLTDVLHIDLDEMEETKLVVVGGVVALQQSMNLLAAQAEACQKAQQEDKLGLDYANFDCFACHHDLKSPSWRQQRGYRGKPGRPSMRPWPLALTKPGLPLLTDGEARAHDLETALQALTQAFDAQPFGDCAAIAGAAKRLSDWSDRTLQELMKTDIKFNEEAAQSLLSKLCSLGDSEVLDYDSARQTAWAIRVIHREVVGRKQKRGPDDVTEEYKDDTKFGKILEALAADLKLDLPSGTNKDITKELPASLQTLNDYDPGAFRKALHKLAEELASKSH
jgi:hypothetical protein